MRLRTRLALALLLLSVVPLAVITVYSYTSNTRAFRRAVEAESSAVAADMGQRMDMVAADVGDRVARVSTFAQARDWTAREQAANDLKVQVATTLGDAGNYLTKLQFTPSAPPPPLPPPPAGSRRFSNNRDRRPSPGTETGWVGGGFAGGVVGGVPAGRPQTPRPPQPADAPQRARAGTSPVPPPPPESPRPLPAVPSARSGEQRSGQIQVALDQANTAAKLVIDLIPAGALPPEAQAALASVKDLSSLKELQNLQLPEIGKPGDPTGAGLQQAAKAMEQRAKEIERRIEEERRAALQTRAAHMQWIERWKQGQPVDIPVRREGRLVGTMNAEIDLRRVMDMLVAGRSRESGELAFLIDRQNHLFVPGPRDRREKDRATLQSLDLLQRVRESKAPVQTVSDDDWIVVARRDPSGTVIGIARPIGKALADIRLASGRNLGLGLLVVLIALVGILPVSSHMTRDLSVLHGGVEKIAQGDLSVRVPVRSKDEIGSLSAAFNQMAQDLGAHQKLIAERERLRGELELCRQLQAEMLPKHPLRLGFAEIKGVSIPAREVGGDFFNYFLLPEGEVAVLVGDVSGKGVGAALLMANVQATLRARLSLEHDLATLADAIDHEIDGSTPQSVYLTLFMGILDSSHHVLRYVNAGHNPQFVLRSDGGLDELPSTGLPIAMFAGHGYREGSVAMNEGDILFFYTDGITEVENEKGDMFGSDRLEALLVKHHEEGVDALLAHIEQEVLQFRGAADLFDDATMMALRLGASKLA